MTIIKKCIGLLVVGLICLMPYLVLADGNQVVISQIQIEGNGGANDEFIEIHNSSASPVLLDNWSLEYKSYSGSLPVSSASRKILPQTCLSAGGYFLLTGSGYNGSTTGDASYSFSLSGASTGATIMLVASSTLVSSASDSLVSDRFAYGNSANNLPLGTAALLPTASATPAGDWAFLRNGNANDNSLDFTVSTSSPRNLVFSGGAGVCSQTSSTSTADSTATTTGSSLTKSLNVKIFRFLPNPGGDDPGNEWVELKNQDTESVVLDGWILDDKNTGSGPASDSLILSGSIASGEIKKFVLPAGSFGLNNSGGDEVNLYFSDKTLADQAVYEVAAYDDGIFELRDGLWQPPTRNTGGGGGGLGAGSSPPLPTTFQPAGSLRLNEIFPNPVGDDAGKEWVEFYNFGNSTTSLEGYFLAHGQDEVWTDAAWVLSKQSVVPPLGYVAIILPEQAFVFKNSGSEKVKLFSPQKQLLDFTIYQDAPEGQAWAKDKNNKWNWAIPTFGKSNDNLPSLASIMVSEILPSPLNGDDEFVELFNSATTTVDLSGFVLKIGSRSKVLSEGMMIKGLSYLTLFTDDLPTTLRNSGQDVLLVDNYNRVVAKITYPKAHAGQAYATADNQNYFWTDKPTPDGQNEIVLAASTIEPAVLGASTGVNKTSSKTVSDSSKILKSTNELLAKVDKLQAQVDEMAGLLVERPTQDALSVSAGATSDPKPQSSPGYLVLATGALVGLVALIKRYFWKEPKLPE